jgi:lipopolysaccharide/colanic/teichoic acid biosynthesis glycosyltransferase
MTMAERDVLREVPLLPAPAGTTTSPPDVRAGLTDIDVSFRRASRELKRSIDLVIASAALVLLSPLLLVVGLAIRLTSPGPALFRQTRIGYRGVPFVMFKFRTMQQDSDDSIHRAFVTAMLSGEAVEPSQDETYKLTDDPRVTRLGAYLRRLSIDELPQLINVLRGEMSMVGPRPALPWEVELFEPEHLIRFQVKPGITGLWQVSGRSEVSFSRALALDAEYAGRPSLGLDLAILLKTLLVVLRRRGAW